MNSWQRLGGLSADRPRLRFGASAEGGRVNPSRREPQANPAEHPQQTATSVPVQELIASLCATVPDYPKPGIVFKDLTPVFADGVALKAMVDALVEPFRGQFDAVAGVEARGFLLAAAAAYATDTGVVTVRKAGKLPREVVSEDYSLEYGTATLEAAARLFARCGVEVAGVGVVMELGELKGRDALDGHRVHSLLSL